MIEALSNVTNLDIFSFKLLLEHKNHDVGHYALSFMWGDERKSILGD